MKRTIRILSSFLAILTLISSFSGCFSIRIGNPPEDMRRQSVINKIDSQSFDTDSFMRFFFDSDFYATDFKGGTNVNVYINNFGRKGNFECYNTISGRLYFVEDEAGFYALNDPDNEHKMPTDIGVSNRLPNIFDIFGADISMFIPADVDESGSSEPEFTSDMIIPDETGESATFSDAFYAEYARYIAEKMGLEGADRDAFIAGAKGEGGYKKEILNIRLVCENDKYKDFLLEFSQGKDKRGEFYYEQTFRYPTELPSEWAVPFEFYIRFSNIKSSGGEVSSLRIDAHYKASYMNGESLINSNTYLVGEMSREDRNNPTFELTYTLVQNNMTAITARFSLQKVDGDNTRNMRYRFSNDGTNYSTVDFRFDYKKPTCQEYTEYNKKRIFEAIRNSVSNE